jgi:hypothetical protein
MTDALKKAHAVGKLVVVAGAGHGFSKKHNGELVMPATVD